MGGPVQGRYDRGQRFNGFFWTTSLTNNPINLKTALHKKRKTVRDRGVAKQMGKRVADASARDIIFALLAKCLMHYVGWHTAL